MIKKYLVSISKLVDVEVYIEAHSEEEATKKVCQGEGIQNPKIRVLLADEPGSRCLTSRIYGDVPEWAKK